MADEPKKDESYEKVLSEMGLGGAGGAPPQAPAFETFPAPPPPPTPPKHIEMLKDVSVNIKVELGRCKMAVEDILKLGPSSVVPLDKLTGDPLDIYVHGRLVAKGEVIVINENFAIRVTEIFQQAK